MKPPFKITKPTPSLHSAPTPTGWRNASGVAVLMCVLMVMMLKVYYTQNQLQVLLTLQFCL